jgi:hypothetical protein
MTIQICGLQFKVIMRDQLRDENNMGKYDGKTGRIHLTRGMSLDQRKETLLHEWVHGVFDANGVDAPENAVSVIATELYRDGFRRDPVFETDKETAEWFEEVES